MGKYQYKHASNSYHKQKPIQKFNRKENSNATKSSNLRAPNHNNRYYHSRAPSDSSRKHQRKISSPSSCSSPSPSYTSSSHEKKSNSSVSSLSSAAQRHRVEHFAYKKGQRLDGRYKVKKLLGDGTFGRVVECKYHGKMYAVKIIKPVEKYINSAKIQRSIIKRVNRKDKNDEFGIVRYVQSFYHLEHFCMVFKPLGKSLYQFLKMNNFRGFPMPLVQSFFKQILNSIGFLHKNGYTHTDLKPENILLEKNQFIETDPNIPLRAPESKTRYHHPSQKKIYYLPVSDTVRIIDFGGATRFDDYHSSIINTRQYRSPQVILQCCKWNEISDVWSIGCIICQLYTGELLFPAYDDEQHLAMIEKNSGKFPSWMLNKIPNSHSEKKIFLDGYINQSRLRHIQNIIGMKIIEEIFPQQPQLIQLLRLCLQIDPNKRISCVQALRHPFFSLKFQQ